ncbi:MAG TPA: protein kinase [Bryobacteraceae bacterium]|nr:protein kinase [Bryobacteraceae bacterium]
MPSELKTENLNWTSLQGTMLGGAYFLERLTSADENTASFKTRMGGEGSSTAVVRLVKARAETADQQVQIWQTVKKGGHPNLLPIWGAGHVQIEGHDVIYVVVQTPDEKLAAVLRERPLEPAEAGEILVSMVGALGHLHAHCLVHGNVSPEQILGVGETVKLSTEGVRRIGSAALVEFDKPKYRAPETVDGNATPAADIWCLGASLVEVLTQRPPFENPIEEAGKLPAPFHEIAQSCLRPEPEARGTLAHILHLYEGRVAPVSQEEPASNQTLAEAPSGDSTAAEPAAPVEEEVPAAAASVSGPISISSPGFVMDTDVPPAEVHELPIFAPAPPQAASGDIGDVPVWQSEPETPVPSPDASAQQAVERAKRRAWAFVAIALAILLAVVWLLGPRSANRAARHPTAQTSAQTSDKHGQTMTLPAAGQSEAPSAPPVTQSAPPPAARTSAVHLEASSALKGTPKSSPAGRGQIWRVILYTYNREADAEKRAAMINRNHPDFHAEVFAPKGEGKPPFLVAIGGAMDRDHALQVHREALRSGLPRDAYLQNYSR